MVRAARFWFLVPLAWLAACGGRYSSTRHDEPSGSAGSAGSAAGTSGTTTAGTSGTSTAGTGSAGTPPICPCDPIDCGPGYIQVPNSNGCCSHCELDQDECVQQNADYLSYRSAIIQMFSSFGCMTNADCVAFYLQNSCDDSCLLTVTAARRAVVDGLNNYAIGACNAACFSDPKPDCGVAPLPVCSNGRCEIVK